MTVVNAACVSVVGEGYTVTQCWDSNWPLKVWQTYWVKYILKSVDLTLHEILGIG